MLNPKVTKLLETFAAAGGEPLYKLTPEAARTQSGGLLGMIAAGPDVAAVMEHGIPGPSGEIRVREYVPAVERINPIVYLHGGGWVLGGLEDVDAVSRMICVAAGARVMSVDYRLAPEAPFPAGLDDCWAAVRWAAARFGGEHGVVVAGDSAGGNLAAACAIRDAREATRAVSHQVLVYPVTDHDFNSASYREHDDSRFLVKRKDMEWFFDHYVTLPTDRNEQLVSPLRAIQPEILAPALVIVAEYDVLRDDGLGYAARLREVGVPVVTSVFDDTIHGFFTLVGVLDGADRAVEQIASFIRGTPSAVSSSTGARSGVRTRPLAAHGQSN